MNRFFLTILGSCALAGLAWLPARAQQAPKTIVMIAGRPSHGPAQHEHNAGTLLLAKCLRENVPGVDVKVHLNAEWPSPEELHKADTIVIYADGGGGHPALQGDHLQQLDKEMKRGCGFVCLHYAVEPTTDKGNKEFQDWLGGCFETHWSVNPHWLADYKELPKHPVTSGVKPFKTNDEWYFHMRFRPNMQGVTPILTAIAPDSTMNRPDGDHSGNPAVREAVKNHVPQTTSWVVQRDDGGRGFGFCGGHFHNGWGNDDQRKLVLNAIVWTAHGDVPADGINSKVTEEDLKQNLDPKPGQGLPEKKPAPKAAATTTAVRTIVVTTATSTTYGLGAGPGSQTVDLRPGGSVHTKGSHTSTPVPMFSKEVSQKTGAVSYSVNLEGAKEVYLVAGEGPDGITADWTDWVDPVLTYKDGKQQKLTELTPKVNTTGFGKVTANANCQGQPMHVEGLKDGPSGYLLGFGTHANSEIGFDLPAGVVKLEGKVGLDLGGTKQNSHNVIEAQIYTSAPPRSAVAAHKNVSASEKPYGFAAAQELMKNFKTPAGLSATLFAAEPQIQNPTNIDIDPRGRIWAVECDNYRSHELRPEGDRIVILESTKGDGIADKETTFWQSKELKNGLGICVLPMPDGKGTRVLLSAAGTLSLLTDTNGTDHADKVEPLLKLGGSWNHDHHLHAAMFGPDGKYYMDFGNAGTDLSYPDGKPVIDLMGNPIKGSGTPYRQGMIVRFDIDLEHAKASNFETLAYNFRNNFKVCVDSLGGMWQSDNDDDGNKGVRINNIVDYGNYGYSDEMTGAAWQSPRTNIETEIPLRHWHQNDPGTIPNLLQTGQGSPTGICVNESPVLGKVFQNQVIHCDAGPRVVRSYPVTKVGAGYKAEIVDILTTDDTWYRPSDCAIAPDGSLFVADWYDPGVGGHATGDTQPGHVRGRLYRVAPEGLAYQVKPADFSSIESCVKALQSPNNSTRYVAWQKLEQALHDQATSAKAEQAILTLWKSDDTRLRARALHLLVRSADNAKSIAYLAEALQDSNADIRAAAVREVRLDAAPLASGKDGKDRLGLFASKSVAEYILPRILKEQDKEVLREYALTLHVCPVADTIAPKAWAALAQKHDGNDRWYIEALGIGSRGREDACLKEWLYQVNNQWNTPAGRDIVWRVRSTAALPFLADLLTAKDATDEGSARYLREFDFLPNGEAKNEALLKIAKASTTPPGLQRDVLQRLASTDYRSRPEVVAIIDRVLGAAQGKPEYIDLVKDFHIQGKEAQVLEAAAANSTDPRATAAIKFLLASPQGKAAIAKTVASEQGEKVARLLGGSGDPHGLAILTDLVTSNNGDATARGTAVKALAQSAGGAKALIQLASSGKLPEALKSTAGTALAMVAYPGISEEAAKVFPAPQTANGKALPPISQLVKLKGDASKGQAVFLKGSCVGCHRVGALGVDFAPALSEIGSKLGKDALYDAILNPNAGISMGFETWQVKFKNGDVAMGLMRGETRDNITMAMPGGVLNVYSKRDIAERTKLSISMMPTGIQQLITQEELVDLVEWLSSLKATNPASKTAATK